MDLKEEKSPEENREMNSSPLPDADNSTNTWQEIFKGSDDQHFGFVDSIEEAMVLLRKYELDTTTKFSCYKSDKMFGSGDPFSKSRKIYFKSDRLPFDGVPFMTIGSKIFDCQHGPDRKKNEKVKFSSLKEGDHSFQKRRFLPQDTMKFGCPAKVVMSEVIKFPGYKIADNTERIRRDMSERIRNDIKNGQKPQYERRIYINLPMETEHKDHVIGEVGGMLQPIDKKLVEKIHILVGEGVKKVDEMKRHLRHYVKNDLFAGQIPPPITNRRYHPKDVDIRNHMYKASVKQMLSTVDQENLEEKIKGWKEENPEDLFVFRPCSVSPTEAVSENGNVEAHVSQKLLFAHQTAWQRHLISRYGDEIMLLDATYKTMRYELPLFFLVVKTNVNYTVVGSFITQDETTASIEEALHIFRDWNPQWKPRYFMTDFCHEEINAIESTFEGTTTYICDFHREQCWERWVRKTDNGLSDQREEVLGLLRNVAKSPTEDAYNENLKSLKTNEVWLSNPQLRNWFEKTWLSEAKRWVWAYRQERFLIGVNTNNGIERQNESFKYQYLKDRNKNSLSGMITILVVEFLPEKYQSYVELNTKYSGRYKVYNQTIPKYLQDKPREFLNHCLDKISKAEADIKPEHIKEGEYKGEFNVRSGESKDTWYTLSFGSNDTMPRCSCPDFSRTGLLCKHFFAIFDHNPDWKWDSLPKSYRESPYISLDEGVIFTSKLKYDSSAENPVDPPLPTFVPQPQVQPKMTQEGELTREAMKCRETLKQITSLTYNIGDLEALKELGSSLLSLYSKLLCHQPTDENTNPHLTKPTKNEKNAKEKPTKEYLPLPVRRKRNKFAKRVGQHASLMRNQYFVHVPVDGNIFVKKKKTQKVKKSTESGKRMKQQPLSPHFTNQQAAGTKRHRSPTEDEEPPADHFKKTKHAVPTPAPTTETRVPVNSTVSASGIKVPANNTKELASGIQGPANNTKVPASGIQGPVNSTKVPASAIQGPANSTKVPASAIQGPANSTKVPASGIKVPANNTKVPASGIQGPANNTKVPASGIRGPANNTKVPASGIKVPANNTKVPASGIQVPANNTKVPASGIQVPANNTKVPASSIQVPASSTQVPARSYTPSPILIDDHHDESSDEDLTWLTIDNSSSDDPQAKLTLYKKSKEDILKPNYWLMDSEIHAGQILLKRSFPLVDGLQDPAVIGPMVIPARSEFVQVINMGKHWVCLSTIGCHSGTVKIFDSYYNQPNPVIINHACRMLYHPGNSVTFVNEKVQKQVGLSDCGLFALAFATDLCHGMDPTAQKYNQKELRQHYISCLESGEMTPFPKTEKRVPYHLACNKTSIPIFCLCRLPNDITQEYVECSACHGWYHPECASIPEWAINSRIKWKCQKCRKTKAKKKTQLNVK